MNEIQNLKKIFTDFETANRIVEFWHQGKLCRGWIEHVCTTKDGNVVFIQTKDHAIYKKETFKWFRVKNIFSIFSINTDNDDCIVEDNGNIKVDSKIFGTIYIFPPKEIYNRSIGNFKKNTNQTIIKELGLVCKN